VIGLPLPGSYFAQSSIEHIVCFEKRDQGAAGSVPNP
jgi:hypothetical protein